MCFKVLACYLAAFLIFFKVSPSSIVAIYLLIEHFLRLITRLRICERDLSARKRNISARFSAVTWKYDSLNAASVNTCTRWTTGLCEGFTPTASWAVHSTLKASWRLFECHSLSLCWETSRSLTGRPGYRMMSWQCQTMKETSDRSFKDQSKVSRTIIRSICCIVRVAHADQKLFLLFIAFRS